MANTTNLTVQGISLCHSARGNKILTLFLRVLNGTGSPIYPTWSWNVGSIPTWGLREYKSRPINTSVWCVVLKVRRKQIETFNTIQPVGGNVP